MAEQSTTPEALRLLVAAVSGGLAGSIVNVLYNRWQTVQAAGSRGRAVLATLTGEVLRSKLLCTHNAQLQGQETASFIRFPTLVASKAAFEDRHVFPRLEPLQDNLATYVLALTHLNELIDLHHAMVPAIDHSGQHRVTQARHDMRNWIARYCDGAEKLALTPERSISLPQLIGELLNGLNAAGSPRKR